MSVRLSPQQALIHAMITTAAVDRDISDGELARIRSIVREMPSFRGYDGEGLVEEAQRCGEMLAKDDGLERVLDLIAAGLPTHLRETAYVFAADVAASDLNVKVEEVRFLELLAARLDLDKLTCAALERAARARHQQA